MNSEAVLLEQADCSAREMEPMLSMNSAAHVCNQNTGGGLVSTHRAGLSFTVSQWAYSTA